MMTQSKESFIHIFSDATLFAEFKEFAEYDNGGNYLRFSENYTRYVLPYLLGIDSNN